MGMNRTSIEWCDFTWNPVTGCQHNCSYCYARALVEEGRLKGTKGYAQGFTPTFHPTRLQQPQGQRKPAKIFVVSMGDLFGEWVPANWIYHVLYAANEAPWHTYQFLTKNPARYKDFDDHFPPHTWIGATARTPRELYERSWLLNLARAECRFASIEPIAPGHEWTYTDFVTKEDRSRVDWAIIGARTGRGAPPPPMETIYDCMAAADVADIPVMAKTNTRLPMADCPKEYPQVA